MNGMNYKSDGMDLFPRMAVGVMGSAGGELSADVCARVERFGALVGERNHVLVTGAAPGLPQHAVLGAKRAGGVVVGVSPALNLEEHVHKYRSPTRGYDTIVFTGSGLMGREIENIRTCDVVMFAGGRSGTLGEFAIAYDEGKVIGVLCGTGGIADSIEDILKMINKEANAILVFESDSEMLRNELERVYLERLLPLHIDITEGHNPDGVLDPN
jgi:uncharacterized protein (TIGR00725 family)